MKLTKLISLTALLLLPSMARAQFSLGSILNLNSTLTNLAQQMSTQVETYNNNNIEDLNARNSLDESPITNQSGLPVLCAQINNQTVPLSGAASTTGTGATTGSAVPIDFLGQALFLTQNINTLDATMRNLIVSMCQSMRSVNRIQADDQQRQVVTDPNAVAAEAAKTEKNIAEENNFLQNGRQLTADGSQTGPLYVKNYWDYINQEKQIGYSAGLNAVQNSGNLYANNIVQAIQQDQASNPIASTLPSSGGSQGIAEANTPKSTLLGSLIGAITGLSSNPVTADAQTNSNTSSFDDQYFMEWIKPQNNFIGSFVLGLNKVGQEIANSKEAAVAQADWGRGFLNNQKCQDTVPNFDLTTGQQLCSHPITVTPASVIQENTAASINWRLTRSSNIQGATDIVPFSRPIVESLATFLPLLFREDTSSGSGSTGSIPAPVGTAPVITLTASTSPLSVIVASGASTSLATISWSAPGANSCTPTNDWLSADSSRTITNVIAQSLSTEGSVSINLPLSFTASASRERNSVVENLNITKDTSNTVTQTSQITILTNNLAGDVYHLTFQTAFGPLTNNVTLSSTTAASAGSAAQAIVASAKSSLALQDELSKYTMTANQGIINIASKPPTYGLSCLNTFGSDQKTVTITRQ